MSELLVFSQTIEGLFLRALGPRVDANLKAKLRAEGLDLDRPLLPTYPFAVWMKSIALAGEVLYPGTDPVQARRELGAALLGGYRETYIGRAMLRISRLIGPRKSLDRAAQYFKGGNNYTETRVREISPTCCELWMNEVGPYPEFTQGILLVGIGEAGAKDLKVEVLNHDGHAATFRVAWTA